MEHTKYTGTIPVYIHRITAGHCSGSRISRKDSGKTPWPPYAYAMLPSDTIAASKRKHDVSVTLLAHM